MVVRFKLKEHPLDDLLKNLPTVVSADFLAGFDDVPYGDGFTLHNLYLSLYKINIYNI